MGLATPSSVLTEIASLALLQLLSASTGLVDPRLHGVPIFPQTRSLLVIPDKVFGDALSRMTDLRSLSIHFIYLPSRGNYLGIPPQSGERVILPAFTYLEYQGTSRYLDGLVARIDAPHL